VNTFRFAGHDTWFLRDGRPFNQGEGVAGLAQSTFPPSPGTVAGALRAALASTLGWRGGAWSEAIRAQLGDGDDLGPLRFQGPHLLQGEDLLLPTPRHLVRESAAPSDNRSAGLRLLRPMDRALLTDQGWARLPVLRPQGRVAAAAGGYLRADDFARVMAGETEGVAVIETGATPLPEDRVGIVREVATRATGDNALYQAQHLRVPHDLSLVVSVAGLPAHVQLPEGFRPFGGEGRMAWIAPHPTPPRLPPFPSIMPDGDRLRYLVTFITPVRLPADAGRTTGERITGLPGELVSACLERPLRIGGWDGVRRRPKPLHSHLPAGSTLFMEASADAEVHETLRRLHGSNLGLDAAWGFGQLLIGSWRSA
jgi:CRISPR-associated protein Cmr3